MGKQRFRVATTFNYSVEQEEQTQVPVNNNRTFERTRMNLKGFVFDIILEQFNLTSESLTFNTDFREIPQSELNLSAMIDFNIDKQNISKLKINLSTELENFQKGEVTYNLLDFFYTKIPSLEKKCV